MKTRSKLERQYLRCGYLPRLDRKGLTIWQPPGKFFSGAELTTCAGFTANLPEVIEAAIAQQHWKAGELSNAVEDKPTESLMDAILVVNHAVESLKSWLMTPAKDGGGGS